jgi:hypothetical protein
MPFLLLMRARKEMTSLSDQANRQAKGEVIVIHTHREKDNPHNLLAEMNHTELEGFQGEPVSQPALILKSVVFKFMFIKDFYSIFQKSHLLNDIFSLSATLKNQGESGSPFSWANTTCILS